jgi:hypothetical protein
MSVFDWGTFVNSLQNIGAFQYLFPFLLALAIFYGILKWSAGDRLGKGPTGLISIILSFFVMLFMASNPMIVWFLSYLGGTTLIVACGILVIIILLGLAGFKLHDAFSGKYMKWLLIFAIIIIALIIFFGAGGGWFFTIPYVIINSDFTTTLILIAIIIIAMVFIMHEGGEEKKEEEPKK